MRPSSLMCSFAMAWLLALVVAPPTARSQPVTTIQGQTYVYKGGVYVPLPGVRIYLLRSGNFLGNPEGGQFWLSDKNGLYKAQCKSGAPVQMVVHLSRDFVPEVQYLAAKPNGEHSISIGLIRVEDYTQRQKANPGMTPLATKLHVVEQTLPKNNKLQTEIVEMRREAENAIAKVNLLVPTYFYPAGEGLKEWQRLFQTATQSDVPVWAIVNPGSGPGTTVNPDYRTIVQEANKNGLKLLGYVHTDYGNRSLDEVKRDLVLWNTLYPTIDGIFLDTMSNQENKLDYYASLYQDIKKLFGKKLVVGNPGTSIPESYAKNQAADVFCIYENQTAKKPSDISIPAWTTKYPNRYWSALVYNLADEAGMRKFLAELPPNNIRFVYVTDAYKNAGVLNPWTRLPKYWASEVKSAQMHLPTNDPK